MVEVMDLCTVMRSGVEVKPNVPLHVEPGEDMIVHISQVLLNRKLDFDLKLGILQ